jgi:hypothetical protein
MEFLERFRKWISSENNRNFLEALAAATIIIGGVYAFIGWVSEHILIIALAGIVVACMFVGVLLYQRGARYKNRSAGTPEYRKQKPDIDFQPPRSPRSPRSPLEPPRSPLEDSRSSSRRLRIVVLATVGTVIVGVLLIWKSVQPVVLPNPPTHSAEDGIPRNGTGPGATGGTLKIMSGSGDFAAISSLNKTLNVSPLKALSGTVMLQAWNLGPAFAVAPLIYTASWGDPSSSWKSVNDWIPSGQSNQTAPLSLVAPENPGVYHIIFAFEWEKGGEHVASGTNFPLGAPRWHDGHDVASLSGDKLAEAQARGYTTMTWLFGGGYSSQYVPVDAITLIVKSIGTFQKPSDERASAPKPTTTFSVPAQVPWYDTGVTVSTGDRITIKASGKIYIGAVNAGQPSISDYQGPAGAVGTSTSNQNTRFAFVAPGLVPWSLVGKIGPSGTPFQVGEQTTVTASVAGRLFLTVNDNNFGDNSGSWNVSVAIQNP